uniref:Mff-like domain-containing protein n=1 Tax=Oncorhynchus tshawytscha TaxID=74940 RepID=A0A8C8FEX9_ONCTS
LNKGEKKNTNVCVENTRFFYIVNLNTISTVLSRVQVVKMSRRLAGLERQNAECRQTELVLFSLLLSACLLNGWLWIRR